jgi:hypothetical protein
MTTRLSARPRGVSDPASEATSPRDQRRPGNSVLAASLAGAGVAPDLTQALEDCFGPGVASLRWHQGSAGEARTLGAEAWCEGHDVHLGGLRPQVDDPHAVEVLAHEAAHALADGGAGDELLSRRDDPGERRADDAGRQFRAYVEGGMQGPAPKLRPAVGGRAAIHRYESGEHADAVDGALAELRGSRDPDLQRKAELASGLLDPSASIKLGNGLKVTPGEITALMGDFYGVFGEDGQLDPQASFEQLWSGDAEEMERLLLLIRSESAGDEVMPHEWENAMEGRTDEAFLYTDPETGEERSYEQLGYLDLATRNDSHFSGPTMSGRDNNMGVYALLHEMALEEAQRQAQLPPGERDLDRLRAMESASMHYLTDRHASGHTFEKQGVMEASGYLDSSKWTWPGGALALDAIQGSGATANLFVKSVHDDWNERGVGVKDAKGDTWTAHGDGHWADAGNAENRRRTAGSVVTSFAELQGVLDGGAAPDAQSYGAFDTVPQWSFGRQRKAEEEAADRTFAGVAPEQLGDQAGGYLQWGLEEVGEGLTAPWEEMMQEWYRAEDYLRRGGDPGRLFGY